MDLWLLRRSARWWPSSQIMQQITASPSKEGFQVSNPLIWAAAHMRHQSTGLAFVHRCHSTWDNESWPLHFPCTLDQASSFVKTSEPASDLCWTLEILKSWNLVLVWKVLTHVYSSYKWTFILIYFFGTLQHKDNFGKNLKIVHFFPLKFSYLAMMKATRVVRVCSESLFFIFE